MKKVLIMMLVALMAITVFAGCQQPAESEAPASEAPASEAPASEAPESEEPSEATESEEPAESSAEVPTVFTEGGIKVAVVRNLAAGDHTQQFLAGAISEGESFGFEVTTYVTDGNAQKLQETVAQVINQDFDGIIVSHGELAYSYDMLKPAADKGMVISTFDTLAYEGGDANGALLEGVTSTSQDDQKLAELSLGDMLETVGTEGEPVKVLKTFMGPGIPPLDRRNEVYTAMEAEGLIETVATVQPTDSSNARGSMTTQTAGILPTLEEGSVDAVWGCYDELAKGVLQAFNDAGRTDMPMFTIDVSNDDINLMLENPDVWLSTAAVDPTLIGIANMRLIALKLAGEETDDEYTLDAQLIKTTQLNDTITMENLADVVDGWGTLESIDDLEAPWMEALRAMYAA